MIIDQHLTVSEAAHWCGGAISHREAARLRQLAGKAQDRPVNHFPLTAIGSWRDGVQVYGTASADTICSRCDRWGAWEARKADHGSESIVGAWPVGSDGVEAGPADDAPQHGGDDDGVVGITEDGHEVRDEINGNSEIGQQQHKPDAYSMREGFVRSQPADQAKHIGQQPQCLAQESAARPDQD